MQRSRGGCRVTVPLAWLVGSGWGGRWCGCRLGLLMAGGAGSGGGGGAGGGGGRAGFGAGGLLGGVGGGPHGAIVGRVCGPGDDVAAAPVRRPVGALVGCAGLE